MNLNVRSIFLMSQAIGKHSMIPRTSGKIINVASIAGLAGNSADMAMVAYNTSKAAVVNFTRTLAGEWGKYNINVNALAPGMFPSKMTKGTIDARRREEPGRPRAAPAHRRRRRPEGRDAAVRVAGRQAHHRPGAADRRRRLRDHRGLIAPTSLPRGAAGWARLQIPSRSSSCSASSCSASSAARPRSRCQLRDELTNSWGVAHGGVR